MIEKRRTPAPTGREIHETRERIDHYRRRRPFALPIVALSFFAAFYVVWKIVMAWDVQSAPAGGVLKVAGFGLLFLGYGAGAWMARCPHCNTHANLVRGFDPTSCWKCHARLR